MMPNILKPHQSGLFRIEGHKKLPRLEKAKGIHHHHTSVT